MVSKIWVGISTTNIHSLQFKIQSQLQKRVLCMPIHQNLIPKKNRLKFSTLHSPFCLFLIRILKLNCRPEYFGFYFSWWNPRIRFQLFILTWRTQNLQFVNLKCDTYAQPIPLPWKALCHRRKCQILPKVEKFHKCAQSLLCVWGCVCVCFYWNVLSFYKVTSISLIG